VPTQLHSDDPRHEGDAAANRTDKGTIRVFFQLRVSPRLPGRLAEVHPRHKPKPRQGGKAAIKHAPRDAQIERRLLRHRGATDGSHLDSVE
jgi:hypothetical protein